MNKVVEILMRRDGLTETEARTYLSEVQSEIDEALASGDFTLVEDIVASELGLEMDYIPDIMFM